MASDNLEVKKAPVISVLIVDDNDMFRAGVQIALEASEGVRIVGVATDGEIAVRKTLELQPDVVLMDIQMPGMNGIAATLEIMKRRPITKIIMLTSLDQENLAMQAIQNGAVGFLYKDAVSGDYLRNGIQTVMQGGSIIHPSILRRINAEAVTKPTSIVSDLEMDEWQVPPSALSPAEIELLTLVAHGAENKQIAEAFNVSPKTIANRLALLFAKINVPNRVGATKYALKTGIVRL